MYLMVAAKLPAMGWFLLLALGLIAFVTARPESSFEQYDFNVEEALLQHGINVTAIPSRSRTMAQSSDLVCLSACHLISYIYGDRYVLVANEAEYDNFTGGYWSSNQAEVNPRCVFQVPNKQAVAVTVLISRLTHCPFAVKSGGHAAFAGSSSIDGGITISLQSLNAIKISSDQKTVAVDPGLTWNQIYTELAKSELAVIGGRVSRIGVGGLTTGGGISFFSSIYGWACDNVAAYDVVTASGRMITASATQHTDLYWALRGGGNNFGVVVTFHLNAFSLPANQLWGGSRVYLEPAFPALINAFANVVANSPSDRNVGQWLAFGQVNGTKFVSNELWYARPTDGNAPVFAEYNAITPGPVTDSTSNRTLTDYTAQLQEFNPYGLRETYYCITIKADKEVAEFAKDVFYEEIQAITHVKGVNPILLYQGITEPQIQAMSRNGGNPLGLTAADGPIYLLSISCWWEDSRDDEAIYKMATKVLDRIKARAIGKGVHNDYLYMNYASLYEDVIRSYGAENKARLKNIAKKYDPTGVWQKLQPGYFKLDHAPVVDDRYFSG